MPARTHARKPKHRAKRKAQRYKASSTKAQRKIQSALRSPLVEQKRNEIYSLTPSALFTDALSTTLWIPNSWEFMSQGTEQNEIIGVQIFSKWLTAKMLVDFEPLRGYSAPYQLRVVQGYCKMPPNPDLTEVGSWRAADLQTHTLSIVKEEFTSILHQADKSRVKILKDFTLNPTVTVAQIPTSGTPPTTWVTMNHRKNRVLDFKWTMMRKIKYTSYDNNGDPQMSPLRNVWIPFVFFIRDPLLQLESDSETNPVPSPFISMSQKHYFTDA